MPLPLLTDCRRIRFAGAALLLAAAAPAATVAQDIAADAPPAPISLVARVIVGGLQGAHGITQVGRFHEGGPIVGNPEFLLSPQPGRVLDPERLLVTTDAGGGAVLSVDPAA